MDIADIQRVSALSTEKQAIQRATELFTKGGRIIEMAVTPQPEPDPIFPRPPVATMAAAIRVPCQYIDYPPQMVDAIMAAFQIRLQQIAEELAKLGVTGMEAKQ